MAKDYARRYKTSPKKSKKKKKQTPLGRLVIFFILGVCVLAGVIRYYHHPVAARPHASLLPPLESAANVQKKRASLMPAEELVDYEFYTLLPKIQVPDAPQDSGAVSEQTGYWLQLMVYYNQRDASAFLDKLQLMGLDAMITQRKSTKTDHDLFMVVLGPFSSKENVVMRQKELKKINLSSYIYHIDPLPPIEEAKKIDVIPQA